MDPRAGVSPTSGGQRLGLVTPREQVVHDGPLRCPYLPNEIARLPLRLPARALSHEEFAQRLRSGDRRQGVLLYRPTCPTCRACEPIRIDVPAFTPSKTQRRILRRGQTQLQTAIGTPTLTREKLTLYNRHKIERGLRRGEELLDADGYEQFLVDTCTDTIELTYRYQGALVGVAIADRAADALSAVYCFFDPAYERLSPGAYSILEQVELCKEWGLGYLYLGLYVGACASMSYKANYLPHERLIAGEWRRFIREP
ncbi:MAG: arginyltransferase [Deltaproteobacteria bacterium]|nr:arginyltransferase [Deltaproteobacteria bacterium]MBI3389428.1 arginyltransferase [Deltaproteobacteria bacterium]